MTNTQYTIDNLPLFIQGWKESVEAGKSAQKVSQDCYHPDAILKGTVWGKAVKGHDGIVRYFTDFTTDKNNIAVTFTNLLQSPAGSFAGRYIFEWADNTDEKHKAEANYTFEPITGPDGQQLISLHHSSFLPPGDHA